MFTATYIFNRCFGMFKPIFSISCNSRLIGRPCSTWLKLKILSITKNNNQSYLFISFRDYSNHYETLGVPKNASLSAIKNAYYAKCKQLHPDRNDGVSSLHNDQFLKVQTAYQVLKLEESRKQYDAYIQSFEQDRFDFTEWKSYKTGKTSSSQYTGQRDYEKYRTTPPPNKGVDAKWSDFTWKDYAVVFGVLFFAINIVQTEIKASKVRRRKYYRPLDIHSPEVHKAIRGISAKSTTDNVVIKPAINQTSNNVSLNTVKNSKQRKLKHGKRLKKKTNPFDEIGSSGSVSDEVLKSLENFSEVKRSKSQNSQNLSTW